MFYEFRNQYADGCQSRRSLLVTTVNAARCWGFVHNNLAEPGTLRLQFFPEPFCHFLDCWILQALDIV